MSIGAKPFAINWNWSGLGFPLDQVLDLISDILSDVAEALFALLGGRFNRTLVTFPNAFPGTSYKYNTALNNVVGQNGDLALTGNITFLAS